MADNLAVLIQVAKSIENLTILAEHSVQCIEVENKLEYPPLDQYGSWVYFLIAYDQNKNLDYVRDKHGKRMWCPFWAYNQEDAIVTSILLAMEEYKHGCVEFTEEFMQNSGINNKRYIKILLDSQFRYVKDLEKHIPADRPNKDWFLQYLSERRKHIRESYKTLLEQ